MATRISQQGREVQMKIFWDELTNSRLPQNITKILHLHCSNYRSGFASRILRRLRTSIRPRRRLQDPLKPMSQKRIPLASIIASVILLIDTFSLSLSSLVIDISDATIVLSDGAVILLRRFWRGTDLITTGRCTRTSNA